MEIWPMRIKIFSLFKPIVLPSRTVFYCDADQEDMAVQTPGDESIRYRIYQLVGPAGVRGCFMVPLLIKTEGQEGRKQWLVNVSSYEAPIKAIDRFLQKSKLRYKLITDYTCWTLEECRAEIRKMVEGM